MTMHKGLYPRDDVDRPYVSRKEGGRGLASIEDSVDESIQRLEDYIKKSRGTLIAATRNNTGSMSINRTKITRKQKWGKTTERTLQAINKLNLTREIIDMTEKWKL